MKTRETMEEFSLLGGPLHWLGTKLGLVREETNTVRLGMALGLFAWGVLVLLGLLQGYGSSLFSLAGIGIHVRLLAVIPLFFLCETTVVPRMVAFVRYIVSSGVVPDTELPALAANIRKINRLRDIWMTEIFFLFLAVLLPFWGPVEGLTGKTGNAPSVLSQGGSLHSLGYAWYMWFCLPLFRFLLLRWLWHLGLWWYFLLHLQRLNLRLIPTHPDRVAGLGNLEIVHERFSSFILAISAGLSASFAAEVSVGTMTLETTYPLIAAVLILIALLFVAPFFMFAPNLRNCRIKGLDEYMSLASRYVNEFDSKWVSDEKVSSGPLLGTPDIQSLADLTNAIDVIRAMRFIPVGRRFLTRLVLMVCAPFLPLLLFEYPLNELALRLIGMLTGL